MWLFPCKKKVARPKKKMGERYKAKPEESSFLGKKSGDEDTMLKTAGASGKEKHPVRPETTLAGKKDGGRRGGLSSKKLGEPLGGL